MLTDYLLANHRGDLIEILKNEDQGKHYTINVNFMQLFEENTSLGNKILTDPEETIAECSESAKTAQETIQDEPKNKDYFIKSNVHVRIFQLPSCPELNRTIFPKNQDQNLFLQISGTVVRTTVVKILEHQKIYKCTKCKEKQIVFADFDQKYIMQPPKRCKNTEECTGNNFIGVSELNNDTCKDYQEVKIQELISRLGVGTMPHSLWVVLEDDLVESCKPGDNVTICGIVKRRWNPPVVGKKLEVEIVIKANHVLVNNDTSSLSIVTPEFKQYFISFWEHFARNPLGARDIIVESFCPQVYGLYIVKLAVLITLAGGSTFKKTNDSGVRTRSEPHLLLVGDPGTAKSQLLRFASKIITRSVLTTGVGSTSAGLTVTALMENGEWQLEAGALVLSDGGVCCIDEFNSMKEHDRMSIHEAMEQQTISVAKASIVCKLNTRCSILAAANPKGQLDSAQPLTINIGLPSPLLSRFDLVIILKDTIDKEWDELVCDYILNGNTGEEKEESQWTLEMMQAYFITIKKINPTLTEDSNRILSTYYQFQRRKLSRNKARTTVRLLDSLVRLSQAHARLMFRDKVEIMDAITAVILVEASMQGDSSILSLNFDIHKKNPENSMENYVQLIRTVLGKLELFDLLEKETNDFNEKYVNDDKSFDDSKVLEKPGRLRRKLNSNLGSPRFKIERKRTFEVSNAKKAGSEDFDAKNNIEILNFGGSNVINKGQDLKNDSVVDDTIHLNLDDFSDPEELQETQYLGKSQKIDSKGCVSRKTVNKNLFGTSEKEISDSEDFLETLFGKSDEELNFIASQKKTEKLDASLVDVSKKKSDGNCRNTKSTRNFLQKFAFVPRAKSPECETENIQGQETKLFSDSQHSIFDDNCDDVDLEI